MKLTPEQRAEAAYPMEDDAPDHDSVLKQRGYLTCIREEVEPLEAWKESAINVMGEWDKVWTALGNPGKLGESTAAASLAEVEKLRDLVQRFVNAWHTADGGHDMHGVIESAKQQGFVPTNTEDK